MNHEAAAFFRATSSLGHLQKEQQGDIMANLAVVTAIDDYTQSGTEVCGPGRSKMKYVLRFLLPLLGLEPWSTQCRQLSAFINLSMFLAAVAAIVYPTIRIGLAANSRSHPDVFPLQIGTVLLMMNAILGVVSLRRGFMEDLHALESYAKKQGFIEVWSKNSLKQFSGMLLLWLCSVGTLALGEFLAFSDVECAIESDLLGFACFCLSSGISAGLMFFQVHIFKMMEMMVDSFCTQFYFDADIVQGAKQWNLIHAMLRRIGAGFDLCFMSTQTAALVIVLVIGTKLVLSDGFGEELGGGCSFLYLAPTLVPLVLLAVGAWTVLFLAASVTEKCGRLPSFVNAQAADPTMMLDSKKLSLVQFIQGSCAGFYSMEVRLTASIFWKVMYLVGLGAFVVATKMTTNDN